MDQQLQARALAQLAETLRAAPDPVHTAEEVVSYARKQLDSDYAGITLIRRQGRLETVAPTDPLVDQVDALQHELAEGPCRDASWAKEPLLCPDLSTETRWPRWAPAVVAAGISAMLSVELSGTDGRRIGAVTSYWAVSRTFTPDQVAFASLFARHAALALATSTEIAGLNVALDSRKRIGQAQGILMARYDLDEERAFEVLRRYSQDNNVKLRDVAEQIVRRRRLPHPHHTN